MKNYTLTLIILSFLLSLSDCTSKYKVVNTQKTASRISLGLKYTGNDQYYIKQTSPIIKELKFNFNVYSASDFDIQIVDKNSNRFQVPQEGIFPIDPLKNSNFPLALSAVAFQYVQDPFDFKIIRKVNNATFFSTYDGQIIFSDYYLQIVTELNSQYTYGLGQRFNPNFKLLQGKWTIFNRDRGQVIDKGTGLQTYGYYPFYLQKQTDNYFHINYFRSSNAMDVIKYQKNDRHYLTYKVIGGIFDFRFFIGEQNAESTIQRFQQYMGRSEIPPFWSLGFHQCRWGYKNITYLQNVLKGYQENGIPLDTIWSDIDYMIDYEDFTIDQNRFPLNEMNQITDKYHYVPIIDAGIKVNQGIAYTEGRNRDLFVKDANGGELTGKVWPGTTTFVDFFHPNSTTYWIDMLEILYQKVKFSGIWLDMNQYANFCNGPCQTPTNVPVFDYSQDLPYSPGSDGIQSHTISLNATHYGNRKQADVHAFSAFLQTYATNLFLKSKNLRPFIIARSSTIGSNKYGFHWTGDNYASFDFLRSSIPDNFLNQMWGFQMVGPDICGFGGNTTVQLCSRWFQIGSLYTFARDHNDYYSISQQPYALGPVVLQAAKNNLKLRYSLLKHYYSLLIKQKGVGTIFKPLMFAFPLDNNVYMDQIANSQFLIGSNLMATPILYQRTTSRNVYFSSVSWYNIYTGRQHKPGQSRISNIKLTDKVPLFLREGTLILTQNTENVTSSKQLDNKFSIIAGFRHDGDGSNATHKLYHAVGHHISLDDYNNDAKIDLCLSKGCEYTFNLFLTVTKASRILTISISYQGGANLNDGITIDSATLLYEGQRVINKFGTPVEITSTSKLDIPIKDGRFSTHQLINEQ